MNYVSFYYGVVFLCAVYCIYMLSWNYRQLSHPKTTDYVLSRPVLSVTILVVTVTAVYMAYMVAYYWQ